MGGVRWGLFGLGFGGGEGGGEGGGVQGRAAWGAGRRGGGGRVRGGGGVNFVFLTGTPPAPSRCVDFTVTAISRAFEWCAWCVRALSMGSTTTHFVK